MDIILVGDFNEVYGADPDGISSIAGATGLINLMSQRHPNERAPTTYARGVKCLDYALGTPKVASAVVAAGYEAFNERFISDHRGYFLDFDSKTMFGSPTQDLASLPKRMLKTSNVKHTTSYIEKVYDLLVAHNAIERADRLTHAGNRHKFAEALDRDVTAACLAAQATFPIFDEAEWSIELALARKRTHAIGKFKKNESRQKCDCPH